MDAKIISLYDAYTHSQIGRREFMSRLVALTGGVLAANSVLKSLENGYDKAETVPESGESWSSEWIQWGDFPMNGYLVSPKSQTNPAVVVIHENRGLNPYIQDVARQLGQAGFLALAVDGLSRQGGTPEDQDKARELIRTLDRGQTLADYKEAVTFLSQQEKSNGKVGCVGFCWGGAMANQLAIHAADLKAAVSFYGRQASTEDVPKINVPLMLHYGGLDERINAGIPDFESALKEHGKSYELFIYQGAHHAFHNHTNQARYNPEAAKLAWTRTQTFLKSHLN